MPRLSGRGRPDHIALTFDDGPDPLSTPLFLRLLAERQSGRRSSCWAARRNAHPGLVREIDAAGHEIGVHGWLHRPLLLRGPRATYDDFARARATVADITGLRPTLFRPPYGVMSTAAHLAAHRLGLTPVLWTCRGEDWTARATPESVHRTVTSGLEAAAAAAPSCSTTPTAPRLRVRGARLWARFPASSTPVSNGATK